MRVINRYLLTAFVGLLPVASTPGAFAGTGAPPWMHALVNAPLPNYDEKTDAVLLYSETNVTVISTEKIRIHVREAYKILRPNGREHGRLGVPFDSQRKVKSIHGWCIPAQGRDFEVGDKDAEDYGIPGAEFVSDAKLKLLNIPAPEIGNLIGYEYEVEEQPLFLQYIWQ
ncbi:MAG: DUF3857 domain-containing protein, partial [Candidatus Sulfotelmatobacter sp.]